MGRPRTHWRNWERLKVLPKELEEMSWPSYSNYCHDPTMEQVEYSRWMESLDLLTLRVSFCMHAQFILPNPIFSPANAPKSEELLIKLPD